MLGLLIIPALLGMALLVDTSSDDDAEQVDTAEDEALPVEDLPFDPQTVETVLQPGTETFDGTDAADVVTGTDAANVISGQAGNDLLESRGGDDMVNGGEGNDTIQAGDGNDFAVGGIGNDNVFLGDGDDISTPLDIDDASMDRGDDLISGGNGDDGILDFRGSDTLLGGAGDDVLAAFGFEDTPDPADRLEGGDGNDTLFGDNGDTFVGGAGEDLFAIIDPETFDTDAVIIEDFNTTDDVLALFVPDAGSGFDTIDLRFDPEENALRAFWRGDEVAILNGLTAADIGNVEVSILDPDDLASVGLG